MKKLILLFAVCSTAAFNLSAQAVGRNKMPKEFTGFFAGHWQGKGEFANGKKIAADASFALSLDSSWLSGEHVDKEPNRFKACSMWGVDESNGQFVAYVFDNFQGHRKFISDGWLQNRLVLTTNEYDAGKGLVFQHFIYEKLSDNRFKMTFETSKDGIAWKPIDYLVFTRN